MNDCRRGAGLLLVVIMLAVSVTTRPALGGSGAEIDREVDAALTKLYAEFPDLRHLGGRSTAILVFPNVAKAGFMFGAQYGEGALRRHGRTAGYYNTVAASYGFQAGLQVFGYALFFMGEPAVQYLDTSGGFELGTGPSVVILDAGATRGLSTTTLQQGIYAILFNQQGLMAGIGLQGSKISRIGH